ncbi:MAG: cytochrome b, partial [Pseudomonadota bacterium]
MSDKYPVAMRFLHWFMAVIIISMIILGIYMGDVDKENPLRMQLYNIHKSFGVTVIFLFALRVAVRLASTAKIPKLPEQIPQLEVRFAHLGHFAIYALMFAVPISGYAMSNSYGYPVKWFTIEMPKLFADDKAFGGLAAQAHEFLAFTLLAVIVIHFAAVIKHR